MRLHRRYVSTKPARSHDPAFGAAWSVPDPLALTTRLYVRFGMRVNSVAAATAHQIGQWGSIDNQQGWGYSFHVGGRPRLAVYPTGLNASLIGIESTRSFADVLGSAYATPPFYVWVAALVDLNVNNAGTTRRFAYWCGTHFGDLRLMDDQTEAGATTFFNSTATVTVPGYVASNCDYFTDLWIGETPDGPALVRPDFELQIPRLAGSFSGGPDTFVGRDGRTYTLGAFGDITRSLKPRPYAA